MKKVGIIIFVIALAAGVVIANLFSFGRVTTQMFNFSLGFGGVRGSGNVATDRRTASEFQKIDVGGNFQVEITAQKEYAVEVETDDNLLPFVTTEVRGGTLHIESERRLSPLHQVRIRIYAPDIDAIDISGTSNVSLNNLSNEGFTVDASGASKLSINGETSKLSLKVSGATRVDGENLKVGNATISASGASRVSVNVSGDLTAQASGASNIVYSGTPASLTVKRSGGGSVSQKN
jgi:hypothetical protein